MKTFLENIRSKIKCWPPSDLTGPRNLGAQAQSPGWYPGQHGSHRVPGSPRPGEPRPAGPLGAGGWGEKLIREGATAWGARPGHSRTWGCVSQPNSNLGLHHWGVQPSPALPLCSLGERHILPLNGDSACQLPARQGLPPAEHGTLTPALLNSDLSHQMSTHTSCLIPSGSHASLSPPPLSRAFCASYRRSVCGLMCDLFHTESHSFVS